MKKHLLLAFIIPFALIACKWDDSQANFLHNCTKTNKNFWHCTYKTNTDEILLQEQCKKMNYIYEAWYKSFYGTCYKYEDWGQPCHDSTMCESKYCIPNDDSCEINCFGRCSELHPPDCLASAQKFTYKLIKAGKIVDKEAWGCIN